MYVKLSEVLQLCAKTIIKYRLAVDHVKYLVFIITLEATLSI